MPNVKFHKSISEAIVILWQRKGMYNFYSTFYSQYCPSLATYFAHIFSSIRITQWTNALVLWSNPVIKPIFGFFLISEVSEEQLDIEIETIHKGTDCEIY